MVTSIHRFSPKEPAVPARITLDPLKMASRHPGDDSWDRRRPRKPADDYYAEHGSKRRRIAEGQPGKFSSITYSCQLEELHTLRRNAFYHLLEHDFIQEFLRVDTCFKMSDKYLLATTFTYFERAGLELIEYTPMNFFAALFLANEMLEDLLFRANMYPLVLPEMTLYHIANFGKLKDMLWTRMGYQALISKKKCEQIMGENPHHWAWRRERKEHHGWAIRRHARSVEQTFVLYPGCVPPNCTLCLLRSIKQAQPTLWTIVNNDNNPAAAGL
ncbi:speedy protein 1-B-like [Rhinophrynus dorsalis]